MICMVVVESKEHFLKLVKRIGKDFFIGGAGNYGTIVGEFLDMQGVDWGGYFDNYPKKSKLCGKPVLSFASAKPEYFVLISSEVFRSEIRQNLHSKNVSDDHIITFSSTDILMELLYCVHKREISAYMSITFFKDLHKKQRCFIIGNGPSLAIQDLNRLENEITFACNSIYALYKKTKWRPTYYCVNDSLAVRTITMPENIGKIQGQYGYLFSGMSHWKHFKDLKNVVLFKTEKGICDDAECASFSDDADKCVYVVGTIAYVMIQLAVYMGFSKIYLLWIDFSFSGERHHDGKIDLKDVQNHADLIEEEDAKYYQQINALLGYSYLTEIDHQLWGYQAANKYADGHGIEIYNATRGGKLEVFPRVDFDKLF